jgi:hypothetical protein
VKGARLEVEQDLSDTDKRYRLPLIEKRKVSNKSAAQAALATIRQKFEAAGVKLKAKYVSAGGVEEELIEQGGKI